MHAGGMAQRAMPRTTKRPLRASRPIVANAEHLEWGDGDACPDDADTCLSIPGQVKWLRWHEPSVTN
jgi:hypothetical protein